MKTAENETKNEKEFNSQGERLKRCLQYAGVKQNELGKAAGYSPQTINKICKNRQPLELHHAVTFARILKVRQEYLLMESPYMTNKEMYKAMGVKYEAIDTAVHDLLGAMGYKIIGLDNNGNSMHLPWKEIVIPGDATEKEVLRLTAEVPPVRYYIIVTPSGDRLQVTQAALLDLFRRIKRQVRFMVDDVEGLGVQNEIVPIDVSMIKDK